MKTSKKLAIYLDHSEAILFDFGTTAIEFKIIKSDFDYQDKKDVIQKGESHLHNKEQDFQQHYYKKLGAEILLFDQVLLFGTTDAKTELFNFLLKNNHSPNRTIRVENSEKLTKNQQLAFVNNYFSKLK